MNELPPRPAAVAPLQPAAGATFSENAIYERMVESILDHRLPPGTKLIEDRLASAFGVSRTRIRPVLVRLANEQVVTLTPNRGAVVAQPTEQEAREVFEVRRMIEPTLITCFMARMNAADMALLKRCIAEEEAARSRGDTRRAIRLSGDFHLHIAQAAQHQTLGRILRELVSRTSLILMTYRQTPRQTLGAAACDCRDHRALLGAIQLGDAREAARLMHEHLKQLEAQLSFDIDSSQAPDFMALFGTAPASGLASQPGQSY
jgi:DNA-binding GntR family transcriptional regulator